MSRRGTSTRSIGLASRAARLLGFAAAALGVSAHIYNATLDPFNLNKNQEATDCIDYTTPERHRYEPSPPNWRAFPTYTLLVDKWIDGNPENNDYFKTIYEYDWRETQIRAGGDVHGLMDARGLDYLQSMGYQAIYIAGTYFINMPWQADGYSALDFSLLDPHFGNLDEWNKFIDEAHRRGIYIIADFTVGTMGDMIGFKGHLNTSAGFRVNEYEVQWKLPDYTPWGFTGYPDFNFTNEYNDTCVYPVFYDGNGSIIDPQLTGCYESTFDQYGDIEAFGSYPDWQRQLAKFASVQDRLREWKPSVLDRLKNFACLSVRALDIDGIRIDKATQVTVDALAEWANHTRECARQVGKNNFFIPGEITGADTFGSVYIGRGRTPGMRTSYDTALNLTNSDITKFLREEGMTPLDSAAFHYSVYRNIARFLGMDGQLSVPNDISVDFVDGWNQMMVNNDMLNPLTNEMDPRHQYGTCNQDVFRWPVMSNGTLRQNLGMFVTHVLLPGIPISWYGEEQALYVLDNSAANYLYGRQSMVSTPAWKRHGCYRLGATQYYNMPYNKALMGCHDPAVALDHFDPTHDLFRAVRQMNGIRANYPAVQDGFMLSRLNKITEWIQFPGSGTTPTEVGLWSVLRLPSPKQRDSGNTTGVSWNVDGDVTQPVWMLYSNMNTTTEYTHDCNGPQNISSPFVSGTTVKNLFYPYEEFTLEGMNEPFYADGNPPYRGCVPSITMDAFGFKAFVPTSRYVQPKPALAKFSPGHDARLLLNGDTVDISFEWDMDMDCESVTQAITSGLVYTGEAGKSPTIVATANGCQSIAAQDQVASHYPGVAPPKWRWSGQITGVGEGVYHIQVGNVVSQNQSSTTFTDHVLLRVGSENNTFVFQDSDYDNSIFSVNDGTYTITHKAFGADKWRYTANYGQEWSDWADWEEVSTLNATKFEENWWKGEHVMVAYWSASTGSAAHVVHADANYDGPQRRYPQLMLRGAFNNWGFDLGLNAHFELKSDGYWTLPLMSAWPAYFQLNVFTYNDYFYGDADGDGVIDRFPPNALTPNFLNVSIPPRPYLAWQMTINDQTGQWGVVPMGHEMSSIIAFALLLIIPVLTALAAAAIFRYSFYSIKVNKWGQKPAKETSYFPIIGGHHEKGKEGDVSEKAGAVAATHPHEKTKKLERVIGWPEDPSKRRKVLIATLEYEILDWQLKVKIGGLGVMSTLMGKAMTDVDLIWVIPKVQDIDYPQGEYAEPIEVVIFGEPYLIEVETHVLDNITYVILDSPVFRAQTKSDPYPQRMDDLSSAIFYSTWNQAIAETLRRFPDVDIYHVNDYHGALAPLYLLPKIMPVCLSLHNAEFQGLWPLRTKEEMKEVCAAFNISKDICSKYVQFGNTFNLLHAAASFISHHQKSVGVAGVSDKYGKRSWARYPALWTLRNIDSLPNPDPTDIAALDEQPIAVDKIQVDTDAESKRPEFKRQAQQWAGIKQDPNADLFVFVGRWSKQKGVDLIADVMPSLLDKKSKIQLICVGPVIDLYGRFAAEKLARLMEMYPDRVYSKPEFTALPPYLFSGADFALIPSRDEPFGLVAVEFGRKGALGVGSRLGGLGLMPGWWFPVESVATQHMLSQLTKTIKLALKSTQEERAILRARSAVQRFPVVEWRQRLEDFQKRSITMSRSIAGHDAWGFDEAGQPGGLYPRNENRDSTLSLGQWNRPGTPDSILSAPSSPQLGDSHRLSDQPDLSGLPPGAGYGDEPNSMSAGVDYHRRFEQNEGSPQPKARKGVRQSGESFYDEDPHSSVLYSDSQSQGGKQRPKFFSGYDDETSAYNSSYASSDVGDTTVVGSASMAEGGGQGHAYDNFLAAANRQFVKNSGTRNAPDPFMERRDRRLSTMSTDSNFAPSRPFTVMSRASSFDSIGSLADDKHSSSLNKAMETFTDADGEVAQNFVQKLQGLSAGNSKGDLCIEKFLMKSEKAFFTEMKKEKLTAMSFRSRDSIMHHGSSTLDGFRPESPQQFSMSSHSAPGEMYDPSIMYDDNGEMEKPMTRTQVFMERSFGGWPLYTIVISLGQLLSATSFQLSLLGGTNTQTAVDMYIICAIFVVSTLFWYTLFRMRPSVYVLSIPWIIFGIAFFMIGLPSLRGPFTMPRVWLTKAATWAYAIASGAGFLFFGLNFGEEAGAKTEVWILRACIVQGLQQIWVSALWYWGYTLSGTNPSTYVVPRAIICVVWPLSAMSFIFGYCMFFGLPEYYHQIPPYVPNFFKTLIRRKLVIWFMIAEILRNYWLATVYGRNWQFLWRDADVPEWAVVIMIAVFFLGVWGLFMGLLIKYAKVHSWLLPVFAVGLGCPRWCQMFWGVSGLGLYVSWGGAAGPYIGTCLWLWLGVLDAVQGVGLGMILLQTLSRLHVCATLAAAQLIGSVVVMIARATSPAKEGPGNVFPNPAFWSPSTGENNPVAHWEFWVCLGCQMVIPFGYFIFFRGEQLNKP